MPLWFPPPSATKSPNHQHQFSKAEIHARQTKAGKLEIEKTIQLHLIS
jgi:hypothetical protein